MSKTKIRVINIKIINEKMTQESFIKESEYINNEYHLNINKSFKSISTEMIRDEIVFLPICKKGYFMASICSFNINEDYEKKLFQKINEIASICISSNIEEYENEIKLIEEKINSLKLIIKNLKKDI